MNSSLNSFNEASLAMGDWFQRYGARSTCSKRTALQRKPIKFGQWPPSPLKVVLGATAMGTLLVVFAIQRVPGDERIVVEKPSIPTVEPKSQSRVEPLKKADREPFSTEPVRVVSLSIEPTPKHPDIEVMPPVSMPPIVKTMKLVHQDEDQPVRRHGGDICSRHGLRRVETHGGRSWRCR